MRNLVAVTMLAVLISTMPAFAADTVTVPWGDWLAEILGAVAASAGTIAILLVTWAMRLLPATLRAYVDEKKRAQVEQLLERAIGYGANYSRDFVTGKKLDIEVGSQVLAGALQYAVDSGPKWLVDWMGGAAGVRDKILSRLDLADGITADDVALNAGVVRPVE